MKVLAWNFSECYEQSLGIYMFGNVMASNDAMKT